MLKIGKSPKYYTLWDVTSELQYTTNSRGEHLPSYNKVTFTYLQNLSLDKDKAIEKAKSKGVTELVPDDELFGRNGSWTRNEYIKKVYEPYQFRFGKYESSDIRDCEDSNYLRWYYNETNNDFAKDRVIELEPTIWTEYDGKLEKVENVKKWLERDKIGKEIEDSIKTKGYVDVFVERNVDDYGILNISGINFKFRGVREQYYSGYVYYIPVINGKGKRIKNKTIRIHTSNQIQPMGWPMWDVDNIEIIKK